MSELIIPNPSLHDVSTYDILVDETLVDPAFQVLSISITKEANKIPLAKIVLRDGEAADSTFPISNEDTFIPGKKSRSKSAVMERTRRHLKVLLPNTQSRCGKTGILN